MGMDLSKVTLPTFVLEPRSLLERLTDFLLHGSLVLEVPKQETPSARMLQFVRWYIASWHHRPKGVKKPYNPILGETFWSWHDMADGSRFEFLAEQVSHHPPVAGIYCRNQAKGVEVNGHFYPRSKFLMNSVASIGEGVLNITFHQTKETYTCTFPTIYCRGILMGSLLMEMGGKVKCECAATGATAQVEFKTKGLFGKEYNKIGGYIKSKKEGKGELYSIGGKWNEVITVTNNSTKQTSVLFDTNNYSAVPAGEATPRQIPEGTDDPTYSRNVWGQVTAALTAGDINQATEHKQRLEEAQRAERKEREAKKAKWTPKYFMPHPKMKDSWMYNNVTPLPF
eukprot:TRINITY_DN67589_c3_g1_i1.p1 TRINITY_DN67589_c3_g1~~TRINITY_DN67589_c3_g1_i1.p1  ORF type:complete len:388 (+),score=41.72 TRINITY_DN67589_c3_g1_i1:145-1164(+)